MNNIIEKNVSMHILQTKQATNIILDKEILQWIDKPQIAKTINSSVDGFYLYLILDEPVIIGDNFYNYHTGHLHVADTHSDLETINKNNYIKIIATTNTSLKNHRNEKLPKIPLSFISYCINMYNTNKHLSPITVQYEKEEIWGNNGSVFPIQYKASITSDNCIIITSHKLQKSGKPTLKELCETDVDLRKEVIDLLYKHTSDLLNGYRDMLDRWITANI